MPFLLRRLAGLVATLTGISLVVFAVMNVLPGDPALTILGLDSTEDARAALSAQLGLDQPVWARYLDWLGGILQSDFGTSYAYRVPVTELILERLPLTLTLGLLASILTIALATALGVFAAARHGKAGDWVTMILSQLGIAIPAFWLSILLVLLFAVTLRVLPSGGFPGWAEPLEALKSLVLPVTALVLVQASVLARVTRASVLEVAKLDYARTARALGLSPRRVMWGHVLPNALVPMVTVAGMQLAGLITGTIVIENVFFLPGLGRLMFQAINNRDLYTVQALVLLFASIVVIVNFLVDMIYLLIDPRLREGRS
ncbi:ABC transporter permease [Pararhodobacter sp. CCB-MM2]|uniref:ABC transporter permease n=1 Tax=Pararhodobacter sp. CCB-MM2 TaxID=1786003 RepID=UPI000830E3FE|nr:ABC transporter permease [Pararhodobacter sp. CCB-MM2]